MAISATEFRSDLPVPPGYYIRERLEELDMTQTALAKSMGRPVQAINEIINGKKAVTAKTTLQLEQALGMSAEAWMNLEARYRLTLERQAIAI